MAYATYVSEKSIAWIRWVLLSVFGGLSMLFAVFLFWSFSKNPVLQYAYASLGLVWELGTIYMSIRLKTSVMARRKFGGWLLGYIVFVSISVGGGVGFNLATTGEQARTQIAAHEAGASLDESTLLARQSLQKKAEGLISDADRYDRQLAALDETLPENSKTIDKLIVLRNRARVAAEAAAKELKKFDDAVVESKRAAAAKTEADRAVSPSGAVDTDVFGSLGELLGASSADVARRWFFIFIVIVIQAIVLVTSPLIADNDSGIGTYRGLAKFIDALFDGCTGRKLNPPWNVAKKLGLTAQVRDHFISLLTTMSYKGRPLVERSHGTWLASYDVVNFKRIVYFLLSHHAGREAPMPEAEGGPNTDVGTAAPDGSTEA